jgi:diguanylate cyclase (GGDEF)-like protein
MILTVFGCLFPIMIIFILYSIFRIPEENNPYLIQLGGKWKIQEGQDPAWIKPDTDDSNWKEVQLPGSFYEQGFHGRYMTIRKDFVLNETMKNQDLLFFIGDTRGSMGIVYVNGNKIGRIGMITSHGEVQGTDDKYGFFINKSYIINGNTGIKNTISIEFDNNAIGYDGIQDPRIFLGVYDRLESYFEMNISFRLFFHYGIMFASIFAMIIFFLLLITEWKSPSRNKYISGILFVSSAVLYNLFFSFVFVWFFFDFMTLVKCLYASIVFLCLTAMDFIQQYFTNKTNILSKINRAICLAIMLTVFIINDIIVVRIIMKYFMIYFSLVILYVCFFCVIHAIKAAQKHNAFVITVSTITVSVTGVLDFLTSIGLLYLPLLFNITISIYIAIGAVLIVADFIKISETNKKLSSELRFLNMNLEAKVMEKTMELSQANEKLKELDSAKNDFIANITHDFRSPLTVILNTADLNLRKEKKNPFTDDFETILSSSYRMKNFIDRLLDLAKMDSKALKLKIRKSDVILFLKTIVRYYQSAIINTNIRITTQFPEKPLEDFYTDEAKLDEVVSNILSNAIKYIRTEDGEIEIAVKEETDSILITISDNGIGIPADKLEAIFNRFEQLEKGRNTKYGGSGIGLAYAKMLVENLKGKIWAESDGEDKGSRFCLRLPLGKSVFNKNDFSNEPMTVGLFSRSEKLVEYDIARKIQKDEIEIFIKEKNRENEYEIKKGVVLIIDDEKPVAKLVMNYLLLDGFCNFIIANSGKTGLEAVYQHNPDIILCDYNMPDFTGSKVHDAIVDNPKYKQIPFIFLSAVSDKNLINERRRRGANAYLKKPIEEKDLLLTIHLHLNKYFEYLKTLELAATDELTGLYNRREVVKRLHEALSVREFSELSLVFFDIDTFKEINDRRGHPYGDQILQAIGRILKQNLRTYDISGRFGGDEFLVILPQTNSENACRVAEILRKNFMKATLRQGKQVLGFTCSFGISSLIAQQNDLEKELDISDLKALYVVPDSENADWKAIQGNKMKIAAALLLFADKALYQSKRTTCRNCGYGSEKNEEFQGALCPKCKSAELTVGRNKISVYSSSI